MRFHVYRSGLCAIFSCCLASQAYADGFDIRQFYPIAGSEGVFSVESSQTMSHLVYDIKLMVDYENTPLVLSMSSQREAAKLEHLTTMTLSSAVGILDFLEVGVSIPFTVYERFNAVYRAEEGGLLPETETGVIDDIQVRVKGTILKRDHYHGFGLGVGAILSLPTGNEKSLTGDGWIWGRPYLVADWEIGPVELMINAGLTFRKKSTFLFYEMSHGFNYGFGVNYHVVKDWLDLKGEIFGETPMSSKASEGFGTSDDDEEPHARYQSVEYLLGLKLKTPIDLQLTAGAGGGIGAGTRNPKYHVLFGIEYAPSHRDADGDGVDDQSDLCPTLAGSAAYEGCPEPDSDGDKWCDPWVTTDELAQRLGCRFTDICPDLEGVDDFEGCPDPDSDLDGWCEPWVTSQDIADRFGCQMTDECPIFPGEDAFKGCENPDTDGDGWCDPWILDGEMAQQFQCKLTDRCPELPGSDEYSGCPEADEDGDGLCAPFVDELGIYDIFFCSGRDLCPTQTEDFDDFEDDDGCPDPDNDHDGICDPWVEEQGLLDDYADICRGVDKCPNEAETINGVKDSDGCPDTGKQIVIVHEDKIEIKEKIFFATNKATIQKQSHSLLDQLTATILANPDIKHLSVEGHTDDTGSYERNLVLSRQRAQAVVDYLVKHGIASERLSAVGYGPDRPIDPSKTPQARALNRRVEFVITERQK